MTFSPPDKLEVFTKPNGERGVKAGVDFPQNIFIAEYEGNILAPEMAEEREKRHETEKEDMYMLQACYNGKNIIFDATYRYNARARLINHSKKNANILLRKPIEIRGKLRIGFVAKRNISKGEELLYDYDLESYSRKELPSWYIQGDCDAEEDHATEEDRATEGDRVAEEDHATDDSQPAVTKLRRCAVPGCGVTVKRLWNHIYGTVHRDLDG